MLSALLDRQAQVVNRRPLLDAGLTDSDVARLVRRRELVRVHRGVFVAHTGEPTWEQRAWAAVLALEPAALAGRAALHLTEGMPRRRTEPPITVAVGWDRRVQAPDGVALMRR